MLKKKKAADAARRRQSWQVASREETKKEKGPDVNLEERVLFLETLVEAIIWGPHLDDPDHRHMIADHLYAIAEAAQRHQSFPPEVLSALNQSTDGLKEIDNTPDALKPAPRRFQPPDGGGAE